MTPLVKRLLSHRSAEFYAIAAVSMLLPFAVLAVLGLVFIWQQGWVLPFFLLLSLSSVLVALAVWAQGRSDADPEELVEALEPKAEWGPKDRLVWDQATGRIGSENLLETPWTDIYNQSINQLLFVAQCYHEQDQDAGYAVSLPEFLLMLEICSRNYRALIFQHVPLSQKIKVSTLRSVYRRRDTLTTTYRGLHLGYRLMRLAGHAPMAVVSELRGALLDSMMSGLTTHMQRNMKKLLFEEVSQVAIELYSGRLRISGEELKQYQLQVAATAEPVMVKPLSVILVGQVNAGKSALVNALSEQCVAEIDVVKSSDQVIRHRLQLTDKLEIELVDTPGIDGETRTDKLLLRESAQADLVLWLSQANQPAKALDRQLYAQWDDYFSRHTERRRPPILLVSTHNDRLPPASEWQPPYDMNAPDSRKVASMRDALVYIQQSLQLPADSSAVAISLAPEGGRYNVDTVRALIESLSEEARASQLNKDRVLASGEGMVRTTWKQFRGMGRVMGRLARDK